MARLRKNTGPLEWEDIRECQMWWPCVDGGVAELYLSSLDPGPKRDELAKERRAWLDAGCPDPCLWEARKRELHGGSD